MRKCQICESGQKCTMGLSYTKILSQEGTKLHKDKVARRHFARWFTFALGEFYVTVTLVPNPYPRSVTFFYFLFFY